MDGSVEDMQSEIQWAHSRSFPWWLKAPYVEITDATSTDQLNQMRRWREDYERREVWANELDQAAPER
jgi:hypothetical protein